MFMLFLVRRWIVLAFVSLYCYSCVSCSAGQNQLRESTNSNNYEEDKSKSRRTIKSMHPRTKLNRINVSSKSQEFISGKIYHPLVKRTAKESYGLLSEGINNKHEVKGKKGHRRQFLAPGGVEPAVINHRFHHHDSVHYIPKPFPVLAIKYVPKPFPVPVRPHVHVSHVYPHCK